MLAVLARWAREQRSPQLKYAGDYRFGRLEIVPSALKNASAFVRKRAASYSLILTFDARTRDLACANLRVRASAY
jgi:hypothetical protein